MCVLQVLRYFWILSYARGQVTKVIFMGKSADEYEIKYSSIYPRPEIVFTSKDINTKQNKKDLKPRKKYIAKLG